MTAGLAIEIFEDEGLKTTNSCQTIWYYYTARNRTLVTFRYRHTADLGDGPLSGKQFSGANFSKRPEEVLQISPKWPFSIQKYLQ